MRRNTGWMERRPRGCGRRAALGLGILLAGLSITLPFPQSFARAAESAAETSLDAKPKSFHATAFIRGSMGIRVIDYWSEGSSMRARTLIAGHPVLTLIKGDRYIAIDLLARQGVSIRRPASAVARDAKRDRPFAFEFDDMTRDGGERIEENTGGALDTEIWQVRDGYGRRKIWVTAKEPRVPLRVETFNRAAGDTHHLDYSNWLFDLTFRPGFFSPPPDIELESLEYEEYTVKAAAGTVTRVPILYPDLLHPSEAP